MTFQPIPDGLLAVLEYGNDQRQWTNTLYFTQPGFGPNDIDDIAVALRGWSELNILAQLASQYELRQITCYDMRTVTGTKYVLPGTGAIGQRVGDTGALSVALVVTFYTNIRGRSGRGRNYITGFIETDMTNVAVNADPVANGIQAAYDSLDAIATGAGWTWVIVQRQENGVTLPQANVNEVQSAVVRNTIFGTQRRRVERP